MRITQVVVLAATSLVSPVAFAETAVDGGPSAAPQDASADAGRSQEDEGSVVAIYGAPPPEHSCRCEAVGSKDTEAGTLGLAGSVLAVAVARRRRRRA
jgi:MYXO-CTERM domain-containing protein